jgi:hypothetical protein
MCVADRGHVCCKVKGSAVVVHLQKNSRYWLLLGKVFNLLVALLLFSQDTRIVCL